jgi:hypothetical protein
MNRANFAVEAFRSEASRTVWAKKECPKCDNSSRRPMRSNMLCDEARITEHIVIYEDQ